MTTIEAAKKWSCTKQWVSERCKEKMIPLAEKIGRVWDIPDEAEKPPCNRKTAVTLLELIKESEKGIEVNMFPIDEEKAIKIYLYLSNWGYISKITRNNIYEKIKKAKITERGKDLIKTSIESRKKVIISGKAGIDLNIFNASLECLAENV